MDKKRRLLWIRVGAFLVSILTIYIWAPWQAALLYFSPLPDSVEVQLQDAIDDGLDGVVVFVGKANSESEFYAKGWHDRQKQIPAREDALFKIASIGKLYNAAVVAKMVASGKLSLDNTLAFYLPELTTRIENSEQITIRMMVQHRSGIPNYTDQEGFSWSEQRVGQNENLDLVLDLPANFPPNSDYAYSNTNYLLLGMIMDKILGFSANQYTQTEILNPLGLSNTYFSVNEVEASRIMSGYYIDYEEDFKYLDQGFVASAEDVGIFLRALIDGTLLTEQEQQIYSSIYHYEHTGWVLGYYSIARYHADIDSVVIQFVNTVGGNTLTHANVVYDRVVEIIRKQQQLR